MDTILFVESGSRYQKFSRLPYLVSTPTTQPIILCHRGTALDNTEHFYKKTYWLKIFRWHVFFMALQLMWVLVYFRPKLILLADERAIKIAVIVNKLFGKLLAILLPNVANALIDVIPNNINYSQFMDRYQNQLLVESLGLPCPSAAQIYNKDAASEFLRAQKAAIYLKANDTFGGLGVWRCETEADVDAAFKQISRSQLPVLAQIDVGSQLVFFAFSAYQGKFLSGVGAITLTQRNKFGPSASIKIIESESMKISAEKLAKSLNLTGLFGIDFILSNNSDLAYFIEFNQRPIGTSYMGTMLQDLVRAASGNDNFIQQPLPVTNLTPGQKIFLFPDEWLRLGREPDDAEGIQDFPIDDEELIRFFYTQCVHQGIISGDSR